MGGAPDVRRPAASWRFRPAHARTRRGAAPARSCGVSGTVVTERVPSPAPDARSAAFIVWFRDAAGEPFGYATVRSLHGELAEHRTGRVLDVPDRAREVVVALLGRDSDGAFALSDVRIEQVETTALYRAVFVALLALWALLGLGAARWVHRAGAPRVTALLLALLAGTFVGVLMPEGLGARIVRPLFHRLPDWLAAGLTTGRTTPLELVYKGGHFLFFLALGLLLFAAAPRLRVRPLSVLLALWLLALGTEGLQLHLFDRTARLSDVAIDATAAVVALLAVRLARPRRPSPSIGAGTGLPPDRTEP